MTETGWPLIPREVLPAPIPAAKRRLVPRASHPAAPGHQLPFFGAETTEPSPGDLAGLLAGPGRLGRMGGTARVSVEVDAAWRVHVLVAELVARGLVTTWRPILQDQENDQGQAEVRDDARDDPADAIEAAENRQEPESAPAGAVEADPESIAGRQNKGTDDDITPTQRFEVLTAYSRRLNGLARAWPDAAAQLFLSGPRLRLWVAAAGAPVPGGYALGLDPEKDLAAIDAALVRAGLAGKSPGAGRHYLIMGKRRLRRLAELVGERPPAAPPDLWPDNAGA